MATLRQSFLEGMLMARMYPQVIRAILQKNKGRSEQCTLLIFKKKYAMQQVSWDWTLGAWVCSTKKEEW